MPPTRRYAPAAEKGPSAWRAEWSGFMSGITLQRARDGTQSVALRPHTDLQEADDAGGAGATFSYLFSSPAERRAERRSKASARERQERERREAAGAASKHQLAMEAAAAHGLKLDGMTRKEKREFLRLTVSKEQQAAEERARSFKMHELMDERLAWYQQGPHPIDLIAEKLVARKADKRAKQLGLRYNYLRPHPSWLARRAQRRREESLVGLGRRFVFDDDGTARDALTGAPVEDMSKVSLLLPTSLVPAALAEVVGAADAGNEEAPGAAGARDAQHSGDDEGDHNGSSGSGGADSEEAPPTAATAKPKQATVPASSIPTASPAAQARSYVRALLPDRRTALALQQANLSTNFLSSAVVKPNDVSEEERQHAALRLFLERRSAASAGPDEGEERASRKEKKAPIGKGGGGGAKLKKVAADKDARPPKAKSAHRPPPKSSSGAVKAKTAAPKKREVKAGAKVSKTKSSKKP